MPLLMVSFFAAMQAAPTFAAPSEAVSGEMLIKFGDAGDWSKSLSLSVLQNQLGEEAVVDIRVLPNAADYATIKMADPKQIATAIATLKKQRNIIYAEPNYIYRPFAGDVTPITPNDPEFVDLWGIKNLGAPVLWSRGIVGSEKINVALIDTGVDWQHPDLKGNLYTNTGEIPDNGIDDDGNGFIDDVHGWNFADGNPLSIDEDPRSHGTHTAGTVGAEGNNGLGVVGVNWKASLMPLKFVGATGGGKSSDAISAIRYAVSMGARVINCSWGGSGKSQALLEALQEARDRGVMIVTAAGNSSNDNDANPVYPASFGLSNMISVAAVDDSDKIYPYSNYGKVSVDIAAPGVGILSTIRGGGYGRLNGTSMAAPHVTGAVALILSAHPDWSPEKIKEHLMEYAVPLLALDHKVLSRGRVHLVNALDQVVTASPFPHESDWQDVAFALESGHPYENGSQQNFSVKFDGAKLVRFVFEKIEIEAPYDYLEIKSGDGVLLERVSGTKENYTTPYLIGDSAQFNWVTDTSQNAYGFKLIKAQIVPIQNQ